MADHMHNDDAPSAPLPVYQLPDWETITHPPKTRQSLLGRILPAISPVDEPVSTTISARPSTTLELDRAKEPSGRTSTLPMRTASAMEYETEEKPALATSLRQHLDSALPPYRTYLGHSRRFLFLYVLLPAAVFFIVLVPLAIGLGFRHVDRQPAQRTATLLWTHVAYIRPGARMSSASYAFFDICEKNARVSVEAGICTGALASQL
ncbi:hypothetical protein M426DRAFT_22684 [Hypoxylon sp. CI-4A]|nr:hypothetical protein M426DRAFT_22684 [Hypoxylon sp. CI-4A]